MYDRQGRASRRTWPPSASPSRTAPIVLLPIISKCRYCIVVRVLGWVCEGPRFHPGRCQLHGLGVRHFNVSGGVPSPPEQPQLVLEWKTRRVKNKNKILLPIVSARLLLQNNKMPPLHPIHLLRVSLLRVLESNFPGDPL